MRFALVLGMACFALGCALGGDDDPRGRDGGARMDAAVTDGGDVDGGAARDGGPPGADGGGCTEDARCTTSCGTVGTAPCRAGALGPCEPPAETCNGADDDCDGETDEDVADRTCSTECGGGVSRCVDGSFTGCSGATPRVEECNGADDDCDGAVDEDLERVCSTICGTGMETCAAGAWGGCTARTPRPEECNGVDDDCNGTPDDGLSRPCSTACGSGTETCAAGGWGTCSARAPQPEQCNDVDDDCNGMVDDGLTRACSTACGSGTERCTRGAWTGCTAPAPRTETCNGADDDCDGRVDEGFQATIFDPVPMSQLTAQQPPCNGPGANLDVCMSAARRWCHAHATGCYRAGGAGHLQATASSARVVCFAGRGDEHNATFAAVASASGIAVDTTNVHLRVAQSAVNRYCRTRGAGAGVGPTEHGGGAMTVTCLPSDVANTVSIPTSDLTAWGCNPNTNPNTLTCSSAADNVCRSRGHRSGFGPVEWNTSDSAIVCFVEP
ncbi:MAG: hypothetical protein KF729_34130 [Sandaracinaceae bacterium]|nr:hypothetical protein [Sandaracinaceae bacterium]